MANFGDQLTGGTAPRVATTRDRIAKYLMIALGLSTLFAFANAAFEFSSLPPDRLIVNTWQMLGFVVFAGLFTLLGLYPRRMPGLWELVLFHKVGATLFNASFIGRAVGPMPSDNPVAVAAIDGTLVVVILVCYVLTRGWQAWAPSR